MAIKAERFKVLDKDTNLPTLDILKVKDSDIYNAAKTTVADLNAEVDNFLKKADINGIVSDVNNVNSELERVAKDITGNLKDITKLSTKDVDKIIGDLFPDNSSVKSIVNQLTDKCKNSAFSNTDLGKPLDSTVNCNGKNKKVPANSCNVSQLSNILNKLTGGTYNSAFNNVNDAVKAIIALTKLSYSANMCGVFSALSGSILNKTALGKTAGSIIGHLSAAKNVLGMIDMANQSDNINLSKGAKLMLNNFKIPKEVTENNYVNFVDDLCNAATRYNISWDSSELDDVISIAILEQYNPEMDKVMEGRRMVNVFSPLELNQAVNDDCDFMSIAYKLRENQPSDFKVFV